nr:MAG TPA: hypothetical protein [Bacteriophage sp.]
MSFDTTVKEFAEFMGSEVKRVEGMIPTGGNSQSTNSLIITGNGRPDKPETTSGKITGNEPNGTFYSSTNGAGVGAYLWQKQNNKWVVISADTGERRMSKTSVNIKEGDIYLRRVNNMVECSFTNGRWGTISFYGSNNPKFTRKNHAKRMNILPDFRIPLGFRTNTPFMLPFYNDDGDYMAVLYVGNRSDRSYIELRFKDNVPTADLDYMRLPVISWITDEPFPEVLP